MLFLVINLFLKKQDQNKSSPEYYFVSVFPLLAAQDMCSPKQEILRPLSQLLHHLATQVS